MSTGNSYVRVRIDPDLKARAGEALDRMGLSVSDAIRMMLVRVAEEETLPFEVKVPNRETRAAMSEVESGGSARFETIDDLMSDLNADD